MTKDEVAAGSSFVIRASSSLRKATAWQALLRHSALAIRHSGPSQD
jgi:hypothetical protein